MSNPFSLDGRIVLVTGGSRGLGWAMAQALARAGGHVVLNGRNADTLQANAEALRAEGLKASVATFDVTDLAAAREGVAAVAREHGRLDVLVNNAGIHRRAPILEMTDEEWQAVIDTNLTACFVMAREAARPMVEQGWGRIINIASVMTRIGRPTVANYTTAKTALAGLTRSFAVELSDKGVNTNAIAPGYFRTALAEDLLRQNPSFEEMIARRAPIGRWGRPEELGPVAVFLASDASSLLTGQVIYVDGGMTAAL